VLQTRENRRRRFQKIQKIIIIIIIIIIVIIMIIIIIKNNIIIIIRTFPACFVTEKFSMLNNLVNLWSKRTLYHVVFSPT